MRGRVGRSAALVLALVLGAGSIGVPASASAPDRGPGTVVRAGPARGPAVLPAAGTAQVLRYRMTSVQRRVVDATGLVLLPRGRAPLGGWPFVVYGHVTTGAADACAPSRVSARSEAREYMTRGDAIATRLLRSGVAVLRPDFEGLGVPGPHPYLIGRSLATATTDMVTAARRRYPSLGRDWVAAGHSEGGVGALFVGSASQRVPTGTRLRGVVAYTPVTQVATELAVLRLLPIRVPMVTDGLSALAGLIIGGAATVDPVLRDLLRSGGLSPEAERLLPHLEQRCLPGLSAADSWGGLAPGAVAGPRGAEALRRLDAVLRANDPAGLTLRAGLPVRIDAGIVDAVAPLPFTEALVARYRRAGVPVTYTRWPGGHPDVVKDGYAAGPSVDWMIQRLR